MDENKQLLFKIINHPSIHPSDINCKNDQTIIYPSIHLILIAFQFKLQISFLFLTQFKFRNELEFSIRFQMVHNTNSDPLFFFFFVSVFYLAQAPWHRPLEDLDNATHYSVPQLTRLTALKKECKLVS